MPDMILLSSFSFFIPKNSQYSINSQSPARSERVCNNSIPQNATNLPAKGCGFSLLSIPLPGLGEIG
jgi:hypothetical protein